MLAAPQFCGAVWLGIYGEKWCTGFSAEIMAIIDEQFDPIISGSHEDVEFMQGDVRWGRDELRIHTMTVANPLPLTAICEVTAQPSWE